MSIFDKLKAPFPPSKISWRVGSTTADKKKGLAFGYIDARDVMERLDEVCGPENWQCSYPHANGKTICSIGVRICREGEGFEWIWKSDGAGDSDVEAEKGAMSDAFKRSAVRFGIGRYLYDIPATWVAIEPMGKSFKIAESEYPRLERVLAGQKAPAPKPAAAKPETQAATKDRTNVAEEPTGSELFVQECLATIARYGDPGMLGGWWNSDEQKKARRDFELDSTQVESLKQAVIKRREELTQAKAA
jgi:hypothetical protein